MIMCPSGKVGSCLWTQTYQPNHSETPASAVWRTGRLKVNLQRETRLEAGYPSCQPCQFSKNEFLSPLIIDLSHALMFGHVGESLDVGAVAQTFEGVCQYGIRRILVPLALLLEAARWSILDDFLNGCRTKTILKVPLSCNQDL